MSTMQSDFKRARQYEAATAFFNVCFLVGLVAATAAVGGSLFGIPIVVKLAVLTLVPVAGGLSHSGVVALSTRPQ